MRKKRGYNREPELKLVKDYRLFAIACEGSKTEPNYFRLFRHISPRISVDIIGDIVTDQELESVEPNKSAPKWVLDRAIKYIEKEGLSQEDELWFIIDVDRWDEVQIREIASYCDLYPNWSIAISNPCFEIWLYFHKRDKKPDKEMSCQELKSLISGFTSGGYHPLKYITDFHKAVENSKLNDSTPDYFYPNKNETKVYLLGETLIEFIGQNCYDDFITKRLPDLILKETEKRKSSTKR